LDSVLASNWPKIDPRASITGVITGSLWIRDGEKDRFECRNRLSGTHRGGSGNLLSFFDLVTKLVTAPVHIILTDGYLVG